MFCTRCGTNNEANARFCRQCATPLASTKSNEPPYPGYQGSQNPGFQGQQPHSYQPLQSYAPQSYPNVSQGASGRAIAALVLMLLSFFMCGPFTSIPAIILGKQEMDAIKRGQASRAGDGLAKAGFYGGIVSTALTCGGILLWFAFVGLAGFAAILGA
jgi:hypothetical protein